VLTVNNMHELEAGAMSEKGWYWAWVGQKWYLGYFNGTELKAGGYIWQSDHKLKTVGPLQPPPPPTK
jgi:hypothetical protein